MPRGRPRKIKPEEVKPNEIPATVEVVGSIQNFESFVVKPDPKPETNVEPVNVPAYTEEQKRIMESREALKHPLPPGQKFFETPDGEIILGDAEKGQIWSRRMNNGRGGWVNPRR